MRAYCLYCGSKVRKTPAQIRKAKQGVFCDRKCAGKWHGIHHWKKMKKEQEVKECIINTQAQVCC